MKNCTEKFLLVAKTDTRILVGGRWKLISKCINTMDLEIVLSSYSKLKSFYLLGEQIVKS